MKTIYLGNLSFTTTEEAIRKLFSQVGKVRHIKMVNDETTGRFRGFGFVQMDDSDAEKAVGEFDGFELNGRTMRVSEVEEGPLRRQRSY